MCQTIWMHIRTDRILIWVQTVCKKRLSADDKSLHKKECVLFVHLIQFLCTSQHFFQLCRDGFSWVEPELSKDLCVLLKDTIQ